VRTTKASVSEVSVAMVVASVTFSGESACTRAPTMTSPPSISVFGSPWYWPVSWASPVAPPPPSRL
jgi:hypothetical protein